MKNWYKNLKDRYATFSTDMQIGNMVSDLNKAMNLESVNPESAKNHLYRALILLDYIIADSKWMPKWRELLRLRESIGSLIVNQHPYGNIEQIIKAVNLMDPDVYKRFRKKKGENRDYRI